MIVRVVSLSYRILLAVVVLAVALSLGVGAAREWLAGRAARRGTLQGLEQAVALAPGNAAYHNQLGRRWQFDPVRHDLAQALVHYRRATELNPRQAEYWLDLAEVYEASGNRDAAGRALERATEAYPVSIEVGWRRGNFLLRRGQARAALPHFRQALAGDANLTPLVIDRCSRAGVDAGALVREGLPAEPRFVLPALHYFVRWEQLAAAGTAWSHLVAVGESVPPREVFPYVDLLVRSGRSEEARRVWVEVLRLGDPGRLAGLSDEERITNGGFEFELLGGGFDWQVQEARGVSWDFDRRVQQSGERSLRLSFDGSRNFKFEHLSQRVPVVPNQRYRFEAYVRTEKLADGSGVRFRLYDEHDRTRLDARTTEMGGTRDWTRVEAEFSTGPATRLLRLVVERAPVPTLTGKLGGTVWIDQVSLQAVSK